MASFTQRLCLLVAVATFGTPGLTYSHADELSDDQVNERYMRSGTAIRRFMQILDGAKELPNPLDKEYFVKPGLIKDAVDDFYATRPYAIQKYQFPFGGSGAQGKLTENTMIFLRTQDMTELNRPTISVVDPNTNDVLFKLIYQRKRSNEY